MIRPTNSAKAGTPIAASIAAEPRSSRPDHGAVTCSTGTLALCVMRTFQPGMTLRLKPLTVTVAVVAVRFALVEVPVSTSSPPASSRKSLAAPTPSDSRALLGAGGSGALLRGGDRDRPGVVVERGLHAQEHDREECGQQDDELDRDRAPLAASPAAAT